MSEFSIAIPAHDRGENGPKWMRELLNSLKEQTYQDFNVIVSDQSKNDNIMDVCKEFDFEFVYLKYEGDNACENLNIALNHCDGRIIKIMFSDDIFISNDALERLHEEYDKLGCKWVFNGFSNWDGKDNYENKIPIWVDRTLEGRNLLSSPSAVSFLNGCKVEFDVDLKLLLDVDFYHRMRWKNGMPNIIQEVLIANREHDDRISSHATSQYDCVIRHPQGDWLCNSKELLHVHTKYPAFFAPNHTQYQKYPDEI